MCRLILLFCLYGYAHADSQNACDSNYYEINGIRKCLTTRDTVPKSNSEDYIEQKDVIENVEDSSHINSQESFSEIISEDVPFNANKEK